MISYDDALANLMAMFPDVDTDTISTVLRDHNGHMERTIDALLVLRGQQPVNSVAPGPAQVAQDEALAMEVQRRLAIQAAMEDQARARQQRQQQQQQQQARARAAARPPPSTVTMTDPILDTFEAIGTSARDKVRELWSRVSGKTSSGPRGSTARDRAAGTYEALATDDGPDTDDDDEIAFDTSLTKRYAVDGDGDGDGAVEMTPVAGTEGTAAAPQDSKKDQ